MADLIYHLTVLMAVTNITWDDILNELASQRVEERKSETQRQTGKSNRLLER